MGTSNKPSHAGLVAALFTPVQARVLGLLFGQPERRYQSAELIRLAQGGTGAVHRQLARLADAGLVTVTRSGNQKHYQARRDSPVFHELHGLVVKTVGLVEPVRQALWDLRREIRAAFIYGSIARGTDRATSDIDLMVISDALDYTALYAALAQAEAALGRRISPTLVTRRDWKRKRASADSFVKRISAARRVFVFGSDDELS
jgi:predicted nucleotidyltransferase